MRRLLVALAGCAHAAPASPLPPPPYPAAAVPAPRWPVAMRVMTWDDRGLVQIGELPGAPPQQLPESWYVEPEAQLDAGTFDRVVDAARAEHVPGLSLRGQAIAARRLDRLTNLPDLHALILDDTSVVDPSRAQVALRRLYVAHTALDDASLARTIAAQPGLEVLDVEDCAIGDAGASGLALLHDLRALDVAGTRIGDATGERLGGLAHLEVLDLGGTRVTVRTIDAIRGLPLRELFLDHTATAAGLASLFVLAPRLVRFDVSYLEGVHARDADLMWLAQAEQLVELGASDADLNDQLGLAIAALPTLREIRLDHTPITGATMAALAQNRELEVIGLGGTPVTDDLAGVLLGLPHVRSLRLASTLVTDAVAWPAPSPVLAELDLSDTQIGDRAMAILDQLPHLAHLALSRTSIGDATIDRIARRAQLSTVVLEHVAGVSQSAWPRLAALHRLERLYVASTTADDALIAALAPAHRLRVLHADWTDVDDDGVDALRAFGELRELTLGETRVRTLGSITGVWSHLETLSLVGLPIDDVQLMFLLPDSVERLDLSSTDITDPSRLASAHRLRELGLVNDELSEHGKLAAEELASSGVTIVR